MALRRDPVKQEIADQAFVLLRKSTVLTVHLNEQEQVILQAKATEVDKNTLQVMVTVSDRTKRWFEVSVKEVR